MSESLPVRGKILSSSSCTLKDAATLLQRFLDSETGPETGLLRGYLVSVSGALEELVSAQAFRTERHGKLTGPDHESFKFKDKKSHRSNAEDSSSVKEPKGNVVKEGSHIRRIDKKAQLGYNDSHEKQRKKVVGDRATEPDHRSAHFLKQEAFYGRNTGAVNPVGEPGVNGCHKRFHSKNKHQGPEVEDIESQDEELSSVIEHGANRTSADVRECDKSYESHEESVVPEVKPRENGVQKASHWKAKEEEAEVEKSGHTIRTEKRNRESAEGEISNKKQIKDTDGGASKKRRKVELGSMNLREFSYHSRAVRF